MPPLSLLLLHEIFPSFPPLWEFLVAGLVLGGAITAIVRRQRRPRIDRLSRLERAVEAHSSSPSSSSSPAVTGREFFGVPWTIPGYALLVVLLGGALSLAIPIASFVIAPGYILMFIVAFRSSWLDHAPGFLPYLFIVVGSWAFWTLCAGVVWRVTRRLSGEAPPPSGPARLNIGGPRA